MVIHQSRYILAGQQLLRLAARADAGDAGPVDRVRADLHDVAALLGLDLDLALRLTPASLVLLLAPADSGRGDPLRTWLAAEVLYRSAEVAGEVEEAEAARAYAERALALYRAVGRQDPDGVVGLELPDPAARVAALEGRLGGGRSDINSSDPGPPRIR